MNVDFFQPIPDHGHMLLQPDTLRTPPGEYVFSVEYRVQEVLKHTPVTSPLHNLVTEFTYRDKKNFTPLAHPLHIEQLHNAACDIDCHIQVSVLSYTDLERSYAAAGDVLALISHFSYRPHRVRTGPPNRRHPVRDLRDTPASLIALQHSVTDVISMNNTLIRELTRVDFSPHKYHTRQLTSILNRTNYFLEFKHAQTGALLEEVRGMVGK